MGKKLKAKSINLSVNVGGVRLRNPVLLASGTCGYGTELTGLVRFSALGGLIAKSVTLSPREGNNMPRVAECAAGMLNAIGLANVGVEAFCQDKLPALRRLPCAVLANAAGSNQAEYLAVVRHLEQARGLAGVELNVSCPNVHAGGLEFGRDPRILGKLVSAVRKQTRLPLWVKLSPNVSDIRPLARAAADAGADALTVINTLIGLRMDLARRRPMLDHVTGGLSGPAIKPVALHCVYRASGAVAIPVVGCGGIETAEDALEFFLAGATAIQVGTAIFREPTVAESLVRDLVRYLRHQRLPGVKPLIGAGRL